MAMNDELNVVFYDVSIARRLEDIFKEMSPMRHGSRPTSSRSAAGSADSWACSPARYGTISDSGNDALESIHRGCPSATFSKVKLELTRQSTLQHGIFLSVAHDSISWHRPIIRRRGEYRASANFIAEWLDLATPLGYCVGRASVLRSSARLVLVA